MVANFTVLIFTSAEYLRRLAAMNALNKIQFVVVNNDIVATISGIFDVSLIVSDC